MPWVGLAKALSLSLSRGRRHRHFHPCPYLDVRVDEGAEHGPEDARDGGGGVKQHAVEFHWIQVRERLWMVVDRWSIIGCALRWGPCG